MEIPAQTPTRERSISDFIVVVPQPYVAGHVVTEGEASALNQTLSENLSNNLRQKLKDGQPIPEGSPEGTEPVPYTPEAAQALVNEYIAQYEMGVRQVGAGSSRVVDPIEREARKLAKEKAKEIIKAKGLKLKDVDLGSISDSIYDANVDALHKAAATLVKQQEKARATAAELATDGLAI